MNVSFIHVKFTTAVEIPVNVFHLASVQDSSTKLMLVMITHLYSAETDNLDTGIDGVVDNETETFLYAMTLFSEGIY